ncbi:hypothetical protein Acr_27g0000260 [Actinidia rufa]|uniref:Uncharacterized protein n=1 Tax=Actinidia rufa TaxID=165716 RepID=A0A7J0H5A6_9ERIC|nr:hypothetical protein Acr_27g0000260 [Actinidia rufa]
MGLCWNSDELPLQSELGGPLHRSSVQTPFDTGLARVEVLTNRLHGTSSETLCAGARNSAAVLTILVLTGKASQRAELTQTMVNNRLIRPAETIVPGQEESQIKEPTLPAQEDWDKKQHKMHMSVDSHTNIKTVATSEVADDSKKVLAGSVIRVVEQRKAAPKYKTLFSREIEGLDPLEKFTPPRFTLYTGQSDPRVNQELSLAVQVVCGLAWPPHFTKSSNSPTSHGEENPLWRPGSGQTVLPRYGLHEGGHEKVQFVEEEHKVLQHIRRNPEAKVVKTYVHFELDEPSSGHFSLIGANLKE